MTKKCVINVVIHKPGLNYIQKQQRLGETLKEHNFDGDFLNWNEFPNKNYNVKNAYNCKAAAFEEALKLGYTEILWLDAAAVIVKPIEPFFDKIKEYGYYILESNYNCAQTCSDKCLNYYNISRDQAETFMDKPSGVIGIDYNNPKGKALLDMFIIGCKEGACDGSRLHDDQSSDKRFLFHRQDQSVLSISANILNLPPIDKFENLVAYKLPVHSKSIVMWQRGYNHSSSSLSC